MQTRRLGNSELEITPIGVGAWAMGGGDWAFSWGKQEDDESIAAIHTALDAGVNWIDTAAVYGLGHSEEVVGKAIAGLVQRPYVFTKCSLVWNDQREIGHSLKAASVRRELEASLRRLRVDVIDLYQRAHVGTKVIVLPMNHLEAANGSRPLDLSASHAMTTSHSVVR